MKQTDKGKNKGAEWGVGGELRRDVWQQGHTSRQKTLNYLLNYRHLIVVRHK